VLALLSRRRSGLITDLRGDVAEHVTDALEATIGLSASGEINIRSYPE